MATVCISEKSKTAGELAKAAPRNHWTVCKRLQVGDEFPAGNRPEEVGESSMGVPMIVWGPTPRHRVVRIVSELPNYNIVEVEPL